MMVRLACAESKNCMRELLSADRLDKPVIALIDPDASRGGLTKSEIHQQLVAADDQFFEKWGFERTLDRNQGLLDRLFEYPPIEWDRIGHFQDVTMRLIAERLLPDASGNTYADNELRRRKVPPPPPPGSPFCPRPSPSCSPARPYLVLRLLLRKFLFTHLPRTHVDTLASCRSDDEDKVQ